jgi:hypothetical protein
MTEIIESIMSYIVCEESFGRMYDFKCKGIEGFADDYGAFYNWNKTCLEEMSDSTRTWVWGLCNCLKDSNLGMMDLEDCGIWTADQLFFDKNKKLCIVHPR